MRIFVIAILGIVSVQPRLMAQSTCHGPDEYSTHFISVFNGMMTPENAAARAKFGLALVDSAHITLVADPLICARAGHAIDSVAYTWDPGTPIPPDDTLPIYVIQIGSSYAVADLNYPDKNDYTMVFIFGSLWQFFGLAGG